jgi:two-component system response regulator AtoC
VPTLLESELFGHERGSFTGANQQKTGRFELAGEGTIFLDEIGDMELGMQTKLLRVLQEREFQRVGGTVVIKFSARIIAATNRDLATMVSDAKFREDLYFRLKVVEIVIPPLRQRRADIPDLVEHLLSRVNRELRQNVSKVPEDFMDALQQYDFPGNVRELENILIAGVMRSTGDVLEAEVPANNAPKPMVSTDLNTSVDTELQMSISEVEEAHIRRVLKSVDGRLGEACQVLGISRPTLRKKMEGYNIS